jgi:tyrosinase co-factor MelC1
MPGGTQAETTPPRSHCRPTDATPCRRAGPSPREADLGPSPSGAEARGPVASGGARRGFLRALFGLGAVATTAAALTPIVVAGQWGTGVAQDAKPSDGQARHRGAAEVFDEMYRGRHIRIVGPQVSVVSRVAHAAGAGHVPAAPFDILIDGLPLHVMRRADGSYLSSVNHYESFPTLLDVARAAVDELGGSQLSSPEPAHHV